MTLRSKIPPGSVLHPARLHRLDRLTAPFQGSMSSLIDRHCRILAEDSELYARLAVWHIRHDQSRPEPYVAVLMTAPSAEHRDVGFALFQELDLRRGSRVIKLLRRHLGKVPRSTRAAVARRLRRLEEHPDAFDREVLKSRRSMKHLYASLHIKPSERADRILFKGEPLLSGVEMEETPTGSTFEPLTDLRIRRDTALLVDKSAGMDSALKLGKGLAKIMTSRLNAELFVYAFDMVPYLVEPTPAVNDLGTSDEDHWEDHWNDAFRHFQAAGATCAGSVLEAMRRKRQRVEQMVVVTGKDETSSPRFHQVYFDYAAAVRTHPEVHVVLTHPDARVWVDRLADAGLPVESSDGSERELWPFLSRPSQAEILNDILSVPLPSRRAA